MANKKQANRKWKIGLKSSAFVMALLLAISQVGIVAFAEDEVGQSPAVETTETQSGGTNDAQTNGGSETVTEVAQPASGDTGNGPTVETAPSVENESPVETEPSGEIEPGESGKATSGKE